MRQNEVKNTAQGQHNVIYIKSACKLHLAGFGLRIRQTNSSNRLGVDEGLVDQQDGDVVHQGLWVVLGVHYDPAHFANLGWNCS